VRHNLKDARVQSAIQNWAPRFVANGVDMNDFRKVTDQLETWEQWFDAWFAMGAQHEELAQNALAEERYTSAASHFFQASMNYHFGKYLFVHNREKLLLGSQKTVSCYRQALPWFSNPGVVVQIPFEGQLLPGYLRFPKQAHKPPVAMIVCGLDSTKEEMHNMEELLLERGLATLAVDGPGQGEVEFNLNIRADYEKVITAVINVLETRPEVDASRVGLMGISLGGYYACRGAAGDPRVKAVVDVAGPFCFGAHWHDEPSLTRQAFRVRSGAQCEEEAEILSKQLTLEDKAANIKCPLLIIHGKMDRIITVDEAYRIYEKAVGPKELLLLEEGNHVCNNLPYRYRPYASDWLVKRLQS
jgi:dienelactone hydrolase